jgi:TRAP-type C4-dicarboxylate transport system permease large subunit
LGCGIAETTVTKVIRQIVYFYAAMVVVQLICTYVPSLSMWLPQQLGLLK